MMVREFFEAHIEKQFRQAQKRERRRKRAMFWAVTHGYMIDISLESKLYYAHMVLRSPKDVRTLLSKIKFAPRYTLVNKRTGIRCEVKGKIIFLLDNDLHDKIFSNENPY